MVARFHPIQQVFPEPGGLDQRRIRDRKTDKNGNSSLEYTMGIVTSASRPGNGSSNAPTISYVQGPNGFLGFEEDGQMRYFILDSQQSVRNIIDDTGVVVQSYEFDEWGNHLPGSGAGSVHSPKTYWGGLSVNDDTADCGLYLAGHRFLTLNSEDSLIETPSDTKEASTSTRWVGIIR
jgi:hypothetical protein